VSPRLQQLIQQATQPPHYRACQLCAHGCTSAGQRCSAPPFVHEPSRDVVALRAKGGACGPDAKHLALPGVKFN
jgi:hypothetical protein